MRSSSRGSTPDMPTKALLSFVLITFGMTWGLGMPFVAIPQLQQLEHAGQSRTRGLTRFRTMYYIRVIRNSTLYERQWTPPASFQPM